MSVRIVGGVVTPKHTPQASPNTGKIVSLASVRARDSSLTTTNVHQVLTAFDQQQTELSSLLRDTRQFRIAYDKQQAEDKAKEAADAEQASKNAAENEMSPTKKRVLLGLALITVLAIQVFRVHWKQ